jgi:hypothetical protein
MPRLQPQAERGREVTIIGSSFDEDRRMIDPPTGLCGNREDHDPHMHESTSLGVFWCEADQSKRLPYAMERREHSEQA